MRDKDHCRSDGKVLNKAIIDCKLCQSELLVLFIVEWIRINAVVSVVRLSLTLSRSP